jgi:DNA-binding NarL/FixJ family response regulator
MIRILLIEEDTLVSQGLRMRLELESDIEIVGEAENSRKGIALAELIHPNVVVIDLKTPGLDGITVEQCLHEISPNIGVVILIDDDKVDAFTGEFAVGEVVVIDKLTSPEYLLKEIRRVSGFRPSTSL